jgi:ribosome biogenesis GTPase
MGLEFLGWDHGFESALGRVQRPGWEPARVTAVDRDSCLVRDDAREVPAELSGSFRFSAEAGSDLPCVGDWAVVQYHSAGTAAIVHDLLPRRTYLRRKTAGREVDSQPVAANLDLAFVVQSCDGNFNLRRLERYLVMIRDGGVRPGLLLTKSDLVDADRLRGLVGAARQVSPDMPLIPVSSMTGDGYDALHALLEPAKTYCLLGSSGVGKTTLVNALVGREAFATGTVREYDGKGRHTTSRRQLILLDQGAMLIDTPGMRELGAIGMSDGIDRSFADVSDLAAGCRFRDCTHRTEVGCAVLAALARGELSQARYESYLKLMSESEFHELSSLEKRRKDRAFGRLVKTVKKTKGLE